jgi:flavin reductase (DIM6/NTAB) family NADH-FMN oxidoreductase RutF
MSSSHAAPPDTLDRPLELDPADWEPRHSYFLVTSLVIPRPIAWVSTRSQSGVPNLAPYSYFNLVSSDPPHVMFSSSGVKDSLRNVRATGEFVLNLVSLDLVEPMNLTAANFPPDQDEFAWSGLTAAPSVRVAAPRVGEAKAHLECRLVQEVPVGSSFVVIGKVVHIHVDPAAWKDGRVDPELLAPVCRLSGTAYAGLGEIFKRARPTWSDVSRGQPGAEPPRGAARARPGRE